MKLDNGERLEGFAGRVRATRKAILSSLQKRV